MCCDDDLPYHTAVAYAAWLVANGSNDQLSRRPATAGGRVDALPQQMSRSGEPLGIEVVFDHEAHH